MPVSQRLNVRRLAAAILLGATSLVASSAIATAQPTMTVDQAVAMLVAKAYDQVGPDGFSGPGQQQVLKVIADAGDNATPEARQALLDVLAEQVKAGKSLEFIGNAICFTMRPGTPDAAKAVKLLEGSFEGPAKQSKDVNGPSFASLLILVLQPDHAQARTRCAWMLPMLRDYYGANDAGPVDEKRMAARIVGAAPDIAAPDSPMAKRLKQWSTGDNPTLAADAAVALKSVERHHGAGGAAPATAPTTGPAAW